MSADPEIPRRVPSTRIRAVNSADPQPNRAYVLYWMVAFRRPYFNFALQRAVRVAASLNKPLVVLEPLRLGYRWANARLHQFVVEGMADNFEAFQDAPVHYVPYLERKEGEGKGLLQAMAQSACMVITDDYPCFFIPKMIEAAGSKLSCRLEAIDSNGLLPLRASPKTFARAHDFRRFLQKSLAEHLVEDGLPASDPTGSVQLPQLSSLAELPRGAATQEELQRADETVAKLPLDQTVAPALRGGFRAAELQMERFVKVGLPLYAEGRNHPDAPVASGLSPWLHFGHLSAHQVFDAIRPEDWECSLLGKPTGKREGWWSMGEGQEAFLDELVTWREVGFNMTHREKNYDSYESLPDWALRTLEEHAADEREYIYSLDQFESASTHDQVWNAAQRQLVGEGRIHNYLRMLWGKKILDWSESPREALRIMEHLNNKYALDGRDPNSYSGIFWVLGRYDRAWGPERPVFGKIRFMTSGSTMKKLRLHRYLARWGRPDDQPTIKVDPGHSAPTEHQ